MIFGDTASIISLDEISRELVEGLPVELGDRQTGNRRWTIAIFSQLRKMGEDRGMCVYSSHGPVDKGGWLLDLVWKVEERREIVLAVESEWGYPSDVEYDFDKLMCVKARYKLLLYNTGNQKESDEVRRRIKQSMEAYPYHLAGEEYLALDVKGTGIHRYYFQVPTDGPLAAIQFENLGEPLHLPVGEIQHIGSAH